MSLSKSQIFQLMGCSNALVIFKESDNWLLQYLCEEGFSHCAVVLYYMEQWMVVDPKFDSVNCIFGVGKLEEYLDICLDAGQTIVQVDYQFENQFSLMPWFRMTSCVTLVKTMLGIKSSCVTPKGLYNKLINKYKGEIYGR